MITIKAGMWFCFKGIVLATPPSIKDSDCNRCSPREGAAGPHLLERCAAAPHGLRLGPAAEGLKRKPESLRKQEGNRNVIVPSRFLWLEQCGAESACAHTSLPLRSEIVLTYRPGAGRKSDSACIRARL